MCGAEVASQDKLVTFGIVPTGPETDYGYIKRGRARSGGYSIQRFTEKPDLATAQSYVSSGEYYWTSGMFIFKASVYLFELKQHQPDISAACKQLMVEIDPDLDFILVNKEAFLACPDDSVDYAVMEKSTKAVVVPLNAGWSDVGSCSSLWDVSAKDENNNVHKGDVLSVASHGNYVYADTSLSATVGLEHIVVVQTKDAVLVAAKDKAQDVKVIVQQLKAAGHT